MYNPIRADNKAQKIGGLPKRQTADQRIQKEDQTQCVRCGRMVSRKWNYCPDCGGGIRKIL